MFHEISPIESPLYTGRSQDGFAQTVSDADPGMTVAEFVQRVFIPEYVMAKRTAGRAHFQFVLKRIVSPERIARAFRPDGKGRVKLAAVPRWPYLDELRIGEIRPEHVDRLIQASIKHGYSSQTANHVRSVVRNIVSYAVEREYITGPNPAAFVTAPSITHKPVRSLSLSQLKQIFELMYYPEQQMALFALLTGMNVAEICGLKWKHVNLSNEVSYASGEPLQARSIAVRTQMYRGEFRAVDGSRSRVVQIAELLHSALLKLKHRPEHSTLEDFVLTCRRGTPINPDNIAARRLKAIGKTLDLTWLSWKVFHRTGTELRARFGRYINKELGNALTLKHWEK
jgi:integrase